MVKQKHRFAGLLVCVILSALVTIIVTDSLKQFGIILNANSFMLVVPIMSFLLIGYVAVTGVDV